MPRSLFLTRVLFVLLKGLGLAEARLRSLASRGSFCREGCVTVQFCHFRQVRYVWVLVVEVASLV